MNFEQVHASLDSRGVEIDPLSPEMNTHLGCFPLVGSF